MSWDWNIENFCPFKSIKLSHVLSTYLIYGPPLFTNLIQAHVYCVPIKWDENVYLFDKWLHKYAKFKFQGRIEDAIITRR